MQYESYTHRFADIILNSDYELRKEIDEVVRGVVVTPKNWTGTIVQVESV